jgi:peptidoglycan-associated lipoprotein
MLKKILPALLLLCVVACGGGTKRPPAVTATPGGGSSRPSATMAPPPETINEGPDVQALDAGGLSESALSDESGEGGPLADVHFEYDAATLTDEARAILEKHAAWIKAHPGLKIAVEGHCDDRGTAEYNLALGDQRARAAYDYLVSLGVPKAGLSAVSYGKERPIDNGSSEAAWARNRRAHFAVSR